MEQNETFNILYTSYCSNHPSAVQVLQENKDSLGRCLLWACFEKLPKFSSLL